MEDELNEVTARFFKRAVHSLLMRWFAIAAILGAVMVLAGEIVASRSGESFSRTLGGWFAIRGVAVSTGSLVLILISWFTRETTKHPGFCQGQLTGRYRVVAWSAVAIAIAAFGAVIWCTLSHGLSTW